MRYKKFIIEKYRAISEPIEVDLTQKSLIPFVGLNECGKTTILNAIYCFDEYNDSSNRAFKHLDGISNLYSLNENTAEISAEIEIDKLELKDIFEEIAIEGQKYKIPRDYSNIITISRIMNEKTGQKKYSLKNKHLFGITIDEIEALFCKKCIQNMPYILYFDDFKENVPDEIIYDPNESTDINSWNSIIEELFEATNPQFSIDKYLKSSNLEKEKIISQVQKKLNKTLTDQWKDFKIDKKDELKIVLKSEIEDITKTNTVFETDPITGVKREIKKSRVVTVAKFKFLVQETDSNDEEHFFSIRDRSKGFFWFFNFVMKIEFNPKVSGSELNAIYLLDEPGSYLHPLAQKKLCEKLKTASSQHKVLFCTHSHNLLDPNIIPINTINFIEKEDNVIKIKKVGQFKPLRTKGTVNAFQPVYEALQFSAMGFDIPKNRKIVLVEGIIDYYCLTMFDSNQKYTVIPCTGAASIINYIPFVIAFDYNFTALWDNDKDGRDSLKKANDFFTEELGQRKFKLLPNLMGTNTIMQNIFHGEDLAYIKTSLNFPKGTSFEKVITNLFYSQKKDEIISTISDKTINNFDKVFEQVSI